MPKHDKSKMKKKKKNDQKKTQLHADDAVAFAFSTNEVTLAIRKVTDLALHVQRSLHETASQTERDRIQAIIDSLVDVRTANNAIECPQPFFGFYTVDKSAIAKFGAGVKAKGKK